MNFILYFNLIFFIILWHSSTNAQNLISNSSFESYTSLPSDPGQLYFCPNWDNVNGGIGWPYGSADYLHTQGTGIAQLPNSAFGNVQPHSGSAIAGFASFIGSVPNFREYISNRFISPMIIGRVYEISFWVTNGSGNWHGSISTDHIGVVLSTTPLNQINHEPINKVPVYEYPGQLWNTGWQKISFSFIADSAYQHLIIGNFAEDIMTTSVYQVNGSFNDSYYFVDDFEIIPTSLLLLAGDTLICDGDIANLNATVYGVSSSYQWTDLSNPGIILSTDSTLSITPHQTTTYQVVNGNLSANITVQVIIPPTLNLGPDTRICLSDSLLLDVSFSSSNYLWQNGSSISSQIVDYEGLYWVELSHFCGQFRDSIYVDVDTLPQLELGADTSICEGTNLILDAMVPSSTFLWQDSSTSATYIASTKGTYSVVLSHFCGQIQDSIQIDIIQPPMVNLGADSFICENESILLNVSFSPANYLWQDNSTNSSFEATQLDTYSVTVTNECGTASDEIIIGEGDCTISLPNAFSPNNDNVNDRFKPIGLKASAILRFRIYNRWGQEVYNGDGSDLGWDGRFMGVEQASEVYIFLLEYKRSIDVKIASIKGEMTLLR